MERWGHEMRDVTAARVDMVMTRSAWDEGLSSLHVTIQERELGKL